MTLLLTERFYSTDRLKIFVWETSIVFLFIQRVFASNLRSLYEVYAFVWFCTFFEQFQTFFALMYFVQKLHDSLLYVLWFPYPILSAKWVSIPYMFLRTKTYEEIFVDKSGCSHNKTQVLLCNIMSHQANENFLTKCLKAKTWKNGKKTNKTIPKTAQTRTKTNAVCSRFYFLTFS